jgi:RNA polymerase sigma-70 factor, ECF subfamily
MFQEAVIDDFAIIQTVIGGDHEAYAELVRRYHTRILTLCYSILLNAAEAEDAAQEVFIKTFASLPRYQQSAAFLTWLSRVASNHCLDVLRKRKRQKTDSLDGMLERSQETGAPIPEMAEPKDLSTERAENTALATRVMAQMTPEQRQILTLREIDELSYEEIAAVLHCSVEAVRARLRRARLELQSKARHVLETGSFIEGGKR